MFAGLALVLGIVGIYGIASHTVSIRTQEIAIRVALGAGRAQIVRMVLGGALRLSVLGAAFGLLVSAALARAIAGLLFAVRPFDPLTLTVSCGCLVAAAVAASYAPAWKATHIDPARALRNE
jgi:ABC-type antimicrobial peptide transport system permease subunit